MTRIATATGEANSKDGARHSAPEAARLLPLGFTELPGWAEDDHAAAFAAFSEGAAVVADHSPKTRSLGTDATALAAILTRAAGSPALDAATARTFFETEFAPFEVLPSTGAGFFTGYYEPEVEGSLTQTAAFRFPLYRQPDDLVEIGPDDRPAGLDPSFRFARRTSGGLVEHPDRAAIMAGALAGRYLELVWLRDPADAFFIHVQGAARIRLPAGRTMRVTYAAKSGHPYTPIGRVLIDMGALPRENVTMQAIRAWLAAHPDEAPGVMAKNRSYIFFREAPVDDPSLGPIAAAKVPLVAGRSLAVDRTVHTFHSPVFVATTLPSGAPFRQLTIAHDTGSAIVGPARGDLFLGSGGAAGDVAGAMRAAGRFIVLLPRTP